MLHSVLKFLSAFQPTNVVNKRPDSKDIVRGQLKALPPIQQNRTRNDLSTVFEAEPWTGDRNPPLADETEYKQNYFLGRDFEKGMENYHNSGPKEFHHVSMNEKYELSKLLRGDVLLPTDPIALSDSQKLTLSKLVCNDLNRFEPNELRDVYLECSQHDKDLRGFCPIEVLDNSLRRHKVRDILKLSHYLFLDSALQQILSVHWLDCLFFLKVLIRCTCS